MRASNRVANKEPDLSSFNEQTRIPRSEIWEEARGKDRSRARDSKSERPTQAEKP